MNAVFNSEPVNTNRQIDIDYIKVLSIFFMITIHVYEILSIYPDVDSGTFGKIIEFLGGPMSAPVFMFSMGIGIIFSKHNTANELINRGIRLFVVAYALNIARGLIPTLLYETINGHYRMLSIVSALFNIDILHFAGLSFILCGLFKKYKVSLKMTLLIAIVMQVAGNLALSIKVNNIFMRYFLGLFIYTCEDSCFPLLLWFIFPVIGMVFGSYLKRVSNLDLFHKRFLSLCLLLYLGLRIYMVHYGISLNIFYALKDDVYYKQNIISTMYCFILFGLFKSIMYFICKTSIANKLNKTCFLISSNLKTIYISQWVIIGWASLLCYFTDYFFDYVYIIPVAIVIFGLSLAITLWYKKVIKQLLP